MTERFGPAQERFGPPQERFGPPQERFGPPQERFGPPRERDWLAERFEQRRDHLRAVAYRMLGSLAEAEDAVQDAWLRVSRADAGGIENLTGWLTTITARVCL